jgi:Ca2+-binding EF-hand superfamily protein
MEKRLDCFKVYEQLSHQQVRKILVRVAQIEALPDPDTITIFGLLNYLHINYSGIIEKINNNTSAVSNVNQAAIDVEQMLVLLVERAKQDGISIEQTFRHFDMDGNGSITLKELTQGLQELGIFNNIPNWKQAVPKIMLKFDSSGDGNVQLKEFFRYLGRNEYVPNMLQKLTKIFSVAIENNKITLRSIFSSLDKDKSGELTSDELLIGIKSIGKFDDITKDDIMSIINEIDKSNDNKVSLNEFVEFFGNRVKLAQIERKEKSLLRVQTKFREIINIAMQDGVSIEQIFSFFDNDKGNNVSKDEFIKGIKAMPNLNKGLTNEDIENLISILDSDNSGTIELHEFKQFINRTTSDNLNTNDTGDDKTVPILQRLHQILKGAEKRGKTPSEVFAGLDKNNDGHLTIEELENGLKRLPFFKELTSNDFKDLFMNIDVDGSGEVSIDEFIEIVTNGGVIPKKKTNNNTSTINNLTGKSNNLIEMFVKAVYRICENDKNGIEGLLAFLDDDGDGLISQVSFFRLLSREKVFSYNDSKRRYNDKDDDSNNLELTEESIEDIIKPLIRKDGYIPVISLLEFLRNKEIPDNVKEQTQIIPNDFSDDEDDLDDNIYSKGTDNQREYVFSNDPETHALEKKLRGLGRMLAKKGINVEGFFKAFDARDCGMVRRTEFLEILSKMGLYILEQGKVLNEENSNDNNNNIRIQQQRQIAKLKRGQNTYLNNASRQVDKLMHGMKEGSDFKV